LMRERGADHVADLGTGRSQLRAFSSHHLCRPLPDMAGVQFFPVYLLRHLIARVGSVYSFERLQEADTPGARAAKEKSFRQYVAWRMRADVAPTIRDYQTRYLAGMHEHPGPEGTGQAAFAGALATLDATLVGTVERYDEFMVLLEYRLREYWPDLDLAYVRQNVSRRRLRWGSVESSADAVLKRLGDLRETLIDENSLDLALYRLANRRLDEQLAGVDKLAERLDDFRQRCRLLTGSNPSSA